MGEQILIVVDMQKDFIDGALGTAEAVAIVPKVMEKIRDFEGEVIFTRDTHGADYLETQEGRKLPVPLYPGNGRMGDRRYAEAVCLRIRRCLINRLSDRWNSRNI